MLNSSHYELAFIYGAAFVLASLYQIGTGCFVDFIMNWISPDSNSYRQAAKALNEKIRQLQGISAQDNFADWARLQRQIEADQKKLDGQQREHQQKNALLGLFVSLFFRFLMAVLWIFVLYVVLFKIQVQVSEEVIGFTIAPPILFLLCFFASVRVTDLLF